MSLRQVKVRHGDDLRSLALRELGDAARWTEVAQLNELRLPFVVRSFRTEDRLAGTVVWGDTVLVPSRHYFGRVATETSTYGQDVQLVNGAMVAVAGDLAVVSGRDNMVQALRHRLQTLRGELIYHPQYGSSARLAIGMKAGVFSSLLAAGWTHETLLKEPRIFAVEGVDAEAEGDAIKVAARVVLINDNGPIDVNLVLNP